MDVKRDVLLAVAAADDDDDATVDACKLQDGGLTAWWFNVISSRESLVVTVGCC